MTSTRKGFQGFGVAKPQRYYQAEVREIIGRTSGGRVKYGPVKKIGLPVRLNNGVLPQLGRMELGGRTYTVSAVYSVYDARVRTPFANGRTIGVYTFIERVAIPEALRAECKRQDVGLAYARIWFSDVQRFAVIFHERSETVTVFDDTDRSVRFFPCVEDSDDYLRALVLGTEREL